MIKGVVSFEVKVGVHYQPFDGDLDETLDKRKNDHKDEHSDQCHGHSFSLYHFSLSYKEAR